MNSRHSPVPEDRGGLPESVVLPRCKPEKGSAALELISDMEGNARPEDSVDCSVVFERPSIRCERPAVFGRIVEQRPQVVLVDRQCRWPRQAEAIARARTEVAVDLGRTHPRVAVPGDV